MVPSAGRETEAPWSPLQAGRRTDRGPLRRLGDGGTMVPSAGWEMEAVDQGSQGCLCTQHPAPQSPKQTPGTLCGIPVTGSP